MTGAGVQDLVFAPELHIPSVEEEVRQSKGSVEEALIRRGVPQDFWKFFDGITGKFEYRPEKVLELSSEDGVQQIDFVRFHMTGNHLSFYYFLNLVAWMKADTSLKLKILAPDDPIVPMTENPHTRRHQEFFTELRRASNALAKTRLTEFEFASYCIKQLPKRLQKRIQLISSNSLKPDYWAQDGSKPIVTKDSDKATIALPWSPEDLYLSPFFVGWQRELVSSLLFDIKKRRRAFTARSLRRNEAIETVQSRFFFQGGNIVVGGRLEWPGLVGQISGNL